MVKCAIGLLKQWFRCLLHAQILNPEYVGQIIQCCAALHNLLLDPDEAALFENEDDWRPDQFLDDSDGDSEEENEDDDDDVTRWVQLVNYF